MGVAERSVKTAHPRVSGENCILAHGVDRVAGSSPRERGKPIIFMTQITLVRLIPA